MWPEKPCQGFVSEEGKRGQDDGAPVPRALRQCLESIFLSRKIYVCLQEDYNLGSDRV